MRHASPYGKAPGQKTASGKRVLGRRAARYLRNRERSRQASAARRTVPPALTSDGSGGGRLFLRVNRDPRKREAAPETSSTTLT